MSVFRPAVNCPTCDKLLVSDGCHIDFTVPDERVPIVNINSFCYQEFECDDCGTRVYFGDDSDMYEYKEAEPEEDEEEDDDE